MIFHDILNPLNSQEAPAQSTRSEAVQSLFGSWLMISHALYVGVVLLSVGQLEELTLHTVGHIGLLGELPCIWCCVFR